MEMAKSPCSLLDQLPSTVESRRKHSSAATPEGDGRKSLRLQQLSEFALPDSLRARVRNPLRKRSKPMPSGNEIEDCRNTVFIGDSSATDAVKSRSTRIKRSLKAIDSADGVQSSSAEGQAIGSGLCLSDAGINYRRLESSFFECDALELAPKLLGKLIRREDVILQITEVEAYRPNDSACHARAGKTTRTEPLFGPAGHAYVYLCYGLHFMLNVVADEVGVGAAVLIRACSPVAGLQTIQSRRGQATDKPILLTGPGKVGQALGLTTEWTNHPFFVPGGLEILDAPSPEKILVGPRVGIDYADAQDVAALWRFALADTPWVSAPRTTLKPHSCD